GRQYDVTPLKSTHSGGDIFQCGTDMTAVYQKQHGTDTSRMTAYLITTGSTTTTPPQSGNSGPASSPTPVIIPTNPPSINPTGSFENEDEDEDEDESRYIENQQREDEHEVENHEEEEHETED
ncbi:MAG: hypothetical protein AAB874_02645, partial [Patescibacteria group bacterium]